MSRFLFFSHDGFGLGHARRNTVIAREVLAADPDAQIVLVTGVGKRVAWLDGEEHVRGRARAAAAQGLRRRLPQRDDAVRRAPWPSEGRRWSTRSRPHRPDVVVVDRHPFGTAGELRDGLELARAAGAALVLGLRDVLDEPAVVAQELAGQGWEGATDLYDRVLVYGAPAARRPRGRVRTAGHTRVLRLGRGPAADPTSSREPRLLAVAAGGGGDGAPVFRLGSRLVELRPAWRGVIAAGPYAVRGGRTGAGRGRRPPARASTACPSCGALFARAEAVLCMAGYNSTLEALAAGRRPILVPRRSPRREQAIRAWRLAALGLADVVDEGRGRRGGQLAARTGTAG